MILPLFPQREAEKGEKWKHQPKGESSTSSGCRQKLCMCSRAQVCQGRTLHEGGCPVGDWLWRPGWKCGFPRKDHGRLISSSPSRNSHLCLVRTRRARIRSIIDLFGIKPDCSGRWCSSRWWRTLSRIIREKTLPGTESSVTPR